jgi:hypothetical protein
MSVDAGDPPSAIQAPLNDYKLVAFLFPLPGVRHFHYTFCFRIIAGIFHKLRSFSHTQFASPKLMNPNYIRARIACRYGTISLNWKQRHALVPVKADREFIMLPGDSPLGFLRCHGRFTDLDKHVQNLPVDVAFVGGHQLRMNVLKRHGGFRLEEIDVREDPVIGLLKNRVGASRSAVITRCEWLIRSWSNSETESTFP